ncbi:uncharacterized protein LOC117784312 [Drosophila innubila]|uniref:uncharacterized protein LOC117784312 n=1 Tax=Drosophila innubila TaxID=198719 RepID=UPI00148C576C|nr:uncharacterized protein LOC117784312 [Drosophila innubila]
MMDERVGSYQRALRKFAIIVYLVTALWLVLAIGQWLTVSLVSVVGNVFRDYEWISVIFFGLAIVLVMVFIFFEQSRFIPFLNWVLTAVIVEFAIIGLFALVVRSQWADMVMWFIVCILLLFLFILLGAVIPHDLTLDVVIIFVISFVFLIASIFMLMLYVLTSAPYSFIMFQNIVSIIMLLFVMYHAQTITGGRFAEMRVNDYLLATIILFYDFIIIYLLTFYVQTKFKIASDALDSEDTSTDDETTTATAKTTTAAEGRI